MLKICDSVRGKMINSSMPFSLLFPEVNSEDKSIIYNVLVLKRSNCILLPKLLIHFGEFAFVMKKISIFAAGIYLENPNR